MVVVSLLTPVATLVTVTLARGTTAPVGSVTTPMIRPVASCAAIGRAATNRRTSSVKAHCQRTQPARLNMNFLPKAFSRADGQQPPESKPNQPTENNPLIQRGFAD